MNHLELDLALGRLNAALDQLAVAVNRHAERDGEHGARVDERQAMEEDRARLATELDQSLARGKAMEDASIAVEARLDKLGAALRGLAAGAGRNPD